jgi:hypothetical protein
MGRVEALFTVLIAETGRAFLLALLAYPYGLDPAMCRMSLFCLFDILGLNQQ